MRRNVYANLSCTERDHGRDSLRMSMVGSATSLVDTACNVLQAGSIINFDKKINAKNCRRWW